MRPLICLLVLAGACTEEDLALQEIVASDAPIDEVRERTEIRWYGEARLTPEGPAIGLDRERTEAWGQPRVPVVEIGERLRVVTEVHAARLLMWLDPEDLGTWIIEDARGGARPGRLDGDSGVFFDGGTEVDVVDRDGDWVAVELETRELEVAAWLPDFDVGPYWVEREREHPRLDRDVFLRGGAEILDAPDGDLLATVVEFGGDEPELPYAEASELDHLGGYSLIEIRDGGVAVVGWVAEEQLSETVRGGWGSSGCGGCLGSGTGWGVHPALHLPAGTPLHAGPEGEWVGETTRDKGWPFGGEVDGWTPIYVHTHWGRATVWVW